MYYIAQTYGIKLSKLYSKNRMPDGSQPAMGQKIKIRGWKRPVRDVVLLSNGPVKPVIGVPGANLPMDNQTGEEQMNNGFDQPAPPPALPKPNTDVLDNRGIDPRTLDKETEEPDTKLPRPATTSNSTKVPTEVPGGKPAMSTPEVVKTNSGNPAPKPVPGGTSAGASTNSTSFYTVVKGDTLYSISKKLNVTLDRLKQLNQLKDNTISVGQQLRIR
jgi:LysM repeat protein